MLEQGPSFEPGTAVECKETLEVLGATKGWCVGDDETLPFPDVWDNSPFSINRGFDIIVPRKTMVVEFSSDNGSGGNPDMGGDDLLIEINNIIANLP